MNRKKRNLWSQTWHNNPRKALDLGWGEIFGWNMNVTEIEKY